MKQKKIFLKKKKQTNFYPKFKKTRPFSDTIPERAPESTLPAYIKPKQLEKPFLSFATIFTIPKVISTKFKVI